MRSDIETIIKSIGHTPIIRLEENLYAKIEAKNPAGSIKDRVAAYMIKDGISRGILKDGSRVAEATSGNTGIGLAYISKQMGFSCDIYMPESMSLMRRELIRQYGANVILTKADEGMAGSVREAKQSLDKNTYFADQFNNPASVTAHYETTAKEIFSDKIYDYVVCGIGTGGTIMGIKKYIEDNKLYTKVVGIEPAESSLITQNKAGKHKIEGIGANFIPSILDVSKIDIMKTVAGDNAVSAVTYIFEKYGLKCGISSGAAYLVAKEIKELTGKSVLAIFPDDGNRYSDSLYR